MGFRRPLITWPGANFLTRKEIIKDFPIDRRQLVLYVPFLGPANEVFALEYPFKAVVGWELSGSLTNLFQVIQKNVFALIARLEMMPVSDEGLYEEFRQSHIDVRVWNKLSKVEQAARFFYMVWNRFQGRWRGRDRRDPGTFGPGIIPVRTNREYRAMFIPPLGELKRYSQFMRDFRFVVYQGDALDRMEDYLSIGNTFAYLDPPYPGNPVYPGLVELGIEWFERLFGLLDAAVCRWLMIVELSGIIALAIARRYTKRLFTAPLEQRYAVGTCHGKPDVRPFVVKLANYPLGGQGGILDWFGPPPPVGVV